MTFYVVVNAFLFSVIASTVSPAVANQVGATCIDCYTLRLTAKYNTSVVDCSKTSLPFCDPIASSCSATPPPQCVNPDNFTCMSDGYFPDPLDCKAFHLCVDLTPTKYSCDSNTPSYYYFDVILHRCTATAECGFRCWGKSGVRVAHPDDPNLFAYCFNGTALMQDRCPGNYELNGSTERCEAVCHTNGAIPDVDDCTKYYKCAYQNYGYYRSHEQCPPGQGFDALTLQCADDVPDCDTGSRALLAAQSV